MKTAISKDGTTIAYSVQGQGPAVILVDGALCYRRFGPMASLAKLLEPHFTVYTYDRRGRGESTDTQPYATEREIEDLAALLKAAGGSASLLGLSSGAALALDAANVLSGIKKLALYEAPFIVDNSGTPRPADLLARMDTLIAENRRSDAVKLFMKTVGAPAIFLAIAPLMPMWKQLVGVAHTLPYDLRFVDAFGAGQPLPTDRWVNVTMPTLALDGGKSPAWIRHAMASLAHILPQAEYRTLPGQTHNVKTAVLAPVVEDFFANQPAIKA